MYYYPGGWPNYPPFPSKERDIPEQQLEPIEDYSEMTEEEIQLKASYIATNADHFQKQRIIKSISKILTDELYTFLDNNYEVTLYMHIQQMIEDGELE